MSIEWLICREPVHIGGADSSSRGNNNPIFRLSDRTPAIPGSSLRGALREGANLSDRYRGYVNNWFGGEGEDISPGAISVGWGWPVWWPVHVLGYGNWWVTCPGWLNRFRQLNTQPPMNFPDARDGVFVSEPALDGQTVYLRWLKLERVRHYQDELPAPEAVELDRRIVVPDTSMNAIVDMGLVRQPRVSLRDEADENGNLVENLFAVEGIPPGAVFVTAWTTRGTVEDPEQWTEFLHGEHFLGGLWSVGYGRIEIVPS